ncbi:putative metal-binding motif-containing protein [Pyxidicoccus trucidator]|uniref:putative metal-binding motif-containing protein n=1 Tax=Pyxidicoccus trucidator TaxID=2709662 RepID=UPI0013D9109F|nr:putative metal-binding motif-containing protein [Pyxidicoccus trucidator]
MIRAAAALLLLLGMSCTVPSLEELHGECDSPLNPVEGAGGAADAVLGENTSACRAVKLTVSYQGFRPACVRVLARDEHTSQELSAQVVGRGEPTGGALIVAVRPPAAWGTEVEVEASAFERTCDALDGNPAVLQSARVILRQGGVTTAALQLTATDEDQDGYVSALSGGTDCNDTNPTINPGVAEERCNGVDDNCNSQSDQEELRLGQTCTEGGSCEGTRQCGDNGAVVCFVTGANTLAWPDVDRDGHGDQDAFAVPFCAGVPAGYVTGLHDDCDDGNATVYAGAPELCDGRDNDCDGPGDETFPQLGTPCTDVASQCAGEMRCNSAGTETTCVVSQPIPAWYPDDDGDGYGQSSGRQQTCAPQAGFAPQGSDCDDGNPFTRPNAPELCDGLDNNCDNQPEAAAVCPTGGPIWAQRTVGSGAQEWRSVFSVVPGGVGVVGLVDARGRLTPGSNTFQTTTTGCTPTNSGWNTLWVDEANNGRSYFGSIGGRLVYQDRTNPNCSQMHDIDRDVRGLVGIRNGTSLELHGVTLDSPVMSSGSTFIWDGGSTVTYGTTGVAPLHDVHGVSRAALFAVGGYDPGSGSTVPEPRIYRFNATSGQWQTEYVQSITGLARLNGVWVVNEKVAFAVGESNSVLRWNGTSWSKMSFPSTNTETLTSVVAFGASSAYATAYNGRIYRYNGQQWELVFEDTSLRLKDIAGTSPADLWVVGENGVILHWPQWPQ